jgi:hypothetical protein
MDLPSRSIGLQRGSLPSWSLAPEQLVALLPLLPPRVLAWTAKGGVPDRDGQEHHREDETMPESGNAGVDGQSTVGNNQSLAFAGCVCARANVLSREMWFMSLLDEELNWVECDWNEVAYSAADYAAKNCPEYFGVTPWRRRGILLVFGTRLNMDDSVRSTGTLVKFRQLLKDVGIAERGYSMFDIKEEFTWAVLVDTAQFVTHPFFRDRHIDRDVEGTLRMLLRRAMCFAAGDQHVLRSTKVLPKFCEERDRMRFASSDDQDQGNEAMIATAGCVAM